jgi:hypothetical protein
LRFPQETTPSIRRSPAPKTMKKGAPCVRCPLLKWRGIVDEFRTASYPGVMI